MSTTEHKAPPALPDDTVSRLTILACFWSVIVLAVPFWYRAVSVERLALPESRVHHWSAQAPCFYGPDACYDQLVSDSRVVKYSRRYNVFFTLLNEDATKQGAITSWDIDALIAQHIDPVLAAVEGLHNVTVTTNINYFAPLSVPVHETPGQSGVTIDEDDLKAFINSAEWNLPTATNLDPSLHLLVYVPTTDHQPMRFKTPQGSLSTARSFLVPQWGALAIHDANSMDDAFERLATAMETLFGLDINDNGNLATLVKQRIAETTKDAVRSLDAIVSLANSIENMRIGHDVQRGVNDALEQLELSSKAVRNDDPQTAIRHAALAQEFATRAYYDPNMLALLYFPDEHKYAIYTPLFGPVAVPLLVAAIKEWKAFKERRRQKRLADQAKKVD